MRGLKQTDMPAMMMQQENYESDEQQIAGEDTTDKIFMGNRRRMQQQPESAQLQQRLGRRYLSAASNEISKRVGAGNYKHCKLEQVITNPKFQRLHMAENSGRMPYQSRELMDIIMKINPSRTSKNQQLNQSANNLYSDLGQTQLSQQSILFSKHNNDIQNENQILAEIIQKQALSKQQHRATLPVNKLMRNLQNRNMRNTQQQIHYNTASQVNQQGRANVVNVDASETSIPIQSYDSMYQNSATQMMYHHHLSSGTTAADQHP